MKKLFVSLCVISLFMVVFSTTPLYAAKEFRVFSPRGDIKVGDKVVITFVDSQLIKKPWLHVAAGVIGEPTKVFDKTYARFPKRLNLNWTPKAPGDFKFNIKITDTRNRNKVLFNKSIKIKVLGSLNIQVGPKPGEPKAVPGFGNQPGSGQPDLKAEMVSLASPLVAGQKGWMIYRLYNVGTADTTVPAEYTVLEAGKIVCKNTTIGVFKKGTSIGSKCEFTVGSPGTHHYQIVVDPYDKIKEIDEANNVDGKGATVTAAPGQPGPPANPSGLQVQGGNNYKVLGEEPDLIVDKVKISPREPKLGNKIEMGIAVKNIKNASVGPKVRVVVKINGRVVWNQYATPVFSNPGVYVTKCQFTAEAAGTNNYEILADAENEIKETNENNNTKRGQFGVGSSTPGIRQIQSGNQLGGVSGLSGGSNTLAEKPDLVISEIKVSPEYPIDSKPYIIVVTVKNLKADMNPKRQCKMILNINNSYLDDAVFSGLKAHQSQTWSFKMPRNNMYGYAGDYTLEAIVDDNKVIDESNEGNNTRKFKYKIVTDKQKIEIVKVTIGSGNKITSKSEKVPVAITLKNPYSVDYKGSIGNIEINNLTAKKNGKYYNSTTRFYNLPIAIKANQMITIYPKFIYTSFQYEGANTTQQYEVIVTMDDFLSDTSKPVDVKFEIPDLTVKADYYVVTCTGRYPNQNSYAKVYGMVSSPYKTGPNGFRMNYTWKAWDPAKNSYKQYSEFKYFKPNILLDSFELDIKGNGNPNNRSNRVNVCLEVDDSKRVEETDETNNWHCFWLTFGPQKSCTEGRKPVTK